MHPGYFAAMRTTLLAGRDFTVADNRQAPPVVLVNESLARRHWPGQDAVGKRIVTGGEGRRMTVVGVVRDVKQHDWHAAPDDELRPFGVTSDQVAPPSCVDSTLDSLKAQPALE